MDRKCDGPTRLDPALVRAYRAAEYRVTGTEPPFVLRVDEQNPALGALQAACGAACSAWLTACNPASVVRTDAENDAAQRSLKHRLAAEGIRAFDAFGSDPGGHWPTEPGVLALGLGRDAAIDTARDFGQNALLWAGADAIPRLVLLR